MKQLILFLIVTAGTFYLAVIYNSDAFVYLGFAEIVMAALCFLYSFISIFGIRVMVETPLNITEQGQRIPVKIKIRNYSIFPTGKIGITLEESHVLFRKKRRAAFFATVEGKSAGEMYAETVIHAEWYSNYAGKAKIRIKKVRCFDLLGMLALGLRKKHYAGEEVVIVMPSFYEIPMEIDDAAREFMAEQERYIQSNTDDTISDQFQIREYQPGDKIRSVHWKLSAKGDELMVRDYKNVLSCPVLLFLDLRKLQGQKRKEILHRREELFTVLLSLSVTMIRKQCSHYVIWYDTKEKDVLRFRMEKEEDLYSLLIKISGLELYPEDYRIEEAYYEKYRERAFADKLVIYWNLHLKCNEETEIIYDKKNLKESLLSQEILFMG